jgi:NADH-quinone oxidoreductase subunit L
VLAYSTISQIGYMFLALGVGAWSAGIFHLVTHAFFKSLLFLGAGAVLTATHHERNMMRLGGLRRELPLTFWTFLVGASSLAALPLVTGGFYSKEMILSSAWFSPRGSVLFWLGGVVGALVTGIYAFRMVFLTFFGEAKTQVSRKPGAVMSIPLVVLAIGAVGVGFIQTPATLWGNKMLSDFLGTVLPALSVAHRGITTELSLEIVASIASVLGIVVAILFYYTRPERAEKIAASAAGGTLHQYWLAGWGFDYVYDTVLVRPFVWIARMNRDDVLDLFFHATAWLNRVAHYGLSLTQTGRLRQYASGIALGALIALWIVVFS